MYIAIPTRTNSDPNSAADINQLQSNIVERQRMGMSFFVEGTVAAETDAVKGLLTKDTTFTSIRGHIPNISNTACVFQIFNGASLVGTCTISRGSTWGSLGTLRKTSGAAWTTMRLCVSQAATTGSLAKDLAAGVEF